MRHTREILRHKWLLGHGHRLVTATLGVSHGAITDTTKRAERAGLGWDAVCALSAAELELRLYPPPPEAGTPRPEPDWALVDLELRKKGVTLELLCQEYLEQHPNGLRRSAFCAYYRVWKKRRGLVMRQHHLGGEKLFVGYAGPKVYYTDPTTGERVACELFVAALGASSYTYAEASVSQKTPEFLASQVRALAFRRRPGGDDLRPAQKRHRRALSLRAGTAHRVQAPVRLDRRYRSNWTGACTTASPLRLRAAERLVDLPLQNHQAASPPPGMTKALHTSAPLAQSRIG